MGRLALQDMLEHSASTDTVLLWHLQHNHYPPVHPAFLNVAKDAIERASNGDWHTVLDLPNGRQLPVGEIIEGLHLQDFLEEGN